jgi:hypothetical protein
MRFESSTALLLVVSAACSDRITPTLVVPDTGTPWVIYATAAVMRPVSPKSVHIVRTSAVNMTALSPDNLGAGAVDMFFAGLKAEDLPSNLTPDALTVVDRSAENAHRLPPLYKSYVLKKPAPYNQKNDFIPTDDPGLSEGTLQERRDRLALMLQDLAVLDGCTPLATPVHLSSINAESIDQGRTLSSGDTFFAIGATGRAVIARLPASAEAPMSITVATGSIAIMREEHAEITDLGDSEAVDQSGVTVPGELAINFIGAFGHGIGQIETFDPMMRQYAVDTPTLDGSAQAIPEIFSGVRHVSLAGAPALCAFGTAQGPSSVSAIWCRRMGSSAWQVSGAFRNTLGMVTMFPGADASRPPIAIDVFGTAYAPNADGVFQPMVRAEVNMGCTPPCSAFQTGAAVRRGASAELRAVIAGSKAQALTVGEVGGSISLRAVSGLEQALFGDERPSGAMALRFTASTFGMDGSLWLGSGEPVLIRVAPDLSSAARICLPREAHGMSLTTIAANDDGRLILGMTPALLGLGRWQ